MKKNYLSLAIAFFILLIFSCGGNETSTETETGETPQTFIGHPTIDKLTQQISETPNSAALYAARAGAWYENENYDEGIADLEKAIELDSTKAEYYHVLADMYMDYYKSRLALNTMKRAGETFPQRIPTLLKLSEFQLILERHQLTSTRKAAQWI